MTSSQKGFVGNAEFPRRGNGEEICAERETACQSHVCHTRDSNHAHIQWEQNFS